MPTPHAPTGPLPVAHIWEPKQQFDMFVMPICIGPVCVGSAATDAMLCCCAVAGIIIALAKPFPASATASTKSMVRTNRVILIRRLSITSGRYARSFAISSTVRMLLPFAEGGVNPESAVSGGGRDVSGAKCTGYEILTGMSPLLFRQSWEKLDRRDALSGGAISRKSTRQIASQDAFLREFLPGFYSTCTWKQGVFILSEDRLGLCIGRGSGGMKRECHGRRAQHKQRVYRYESS